MNINYSLINPSNDSEHGENILKMFILSSILAKELRYTTTLYGTQDVINKIGHWYDSSIVVSNTDFKLYDDFKVRIWDISDFRSMTMDGDIFLYGNLKFSLNMFDSEVISAEDFDLIPGYAVLKALEVFNSFGPSDIVPEWDYKNTASLNTGIIYWHRGNDKFKKYYIQKYYELRDWFLKFEPEMKTLHPFLKQYSSIPSHFICEHLLYQLVKYYNFSADILKQSDINYYKHLKGTNKLNDRKLESSISLLLDTYIQNSGKVSMQRIYQKLINENKIISIFNYRN